MIVDKDRIPRFELGLEEAATLANALRALAYQEPLNGAQSLLWARLNEWLRQNGATRDANGWWRGPSRKEVAR